MDKIRMRFSKTGRSIYISHLDLMHTMPRAFSRAGYRIRYSEGYNPHPIISIALPLSVGTSSRCELMDFRLEGEVELCEIAGRLNRVLPEGIAVQEVYEPQRKTAELKWLAVEGRLEYDGRDFPACAEALKAFFSAASLVIIKKTKRGTADFDLVSGIRSAEFLAGENGVLLKAMISAQEPTFNPDLFCEALRQKAPNLLPDFAAFTRMETYDREMTVFR